MPKRERHTILWFASHIYLIYTLNLWLWLCWPGAAVQDAENPGKVMCGSTQSLHIYSRVLQDPFQVSEEYNKYFNDFIQQKECQVEYVKPF